MHDHLVMLGLKASTGLPETASGWLVAWPAGDCGHEHGTEREAIACKHQIGWIEGVRIEPV